MSLKRFLSFSIPLIVMLISFVIYVSISKMIDQYEKKITNDYKVVLVATTPLTEDDLDGFASFRLKTLESLPRDAILEELKKEVTEGSFTLLQVKLPFFYTISFKEFPTTSRLVQIKKDLMTLGGIKSVETFSKDHDQVYSLFLFIQTVSITLFGFMGIFTFFIIASQINLWFYEHHERLQIINLHGGSLLYGAKPIIRLAFGSGIFSGFFVVGVFFLLGENLSLIFTPEVIELIEQNKISYEIYEMAGVVGLSLVISFVTVIGVLLKHRFK